MPDAGFEPARYKYRGILSPLRLPIPPIRQSEVRDSNPRPPPWQGGALPAELTSHNNAD